MNLQKPHLIKSLQSNRDIITKSQVTRSSAITGETYIPSRRSFIYFSLSRIIFQKFRSYVTATQQEEPTLQILNALLQGYGPHCLPLPVEFQKPLLSGRLRWRKDLRCTFSVLSSGDLGQAHSSGKNTPTVYAGR